MKTEILNVKLPGSSFPTRMLFCCCTGDISKKMAQQICHEFKSQNASAILLFHVGRIDKDAKELFKREKHLATSIDDRLITVQISRDDARKLIGLRIAADLHLDLDEEWAKRIIRRISSERLKLLDRINMQLQKWKEMGIVIENPRLSACRNEGQLVAALEFFIDLYPDLPLTAEEAFNKHAKLEKLARAGEREFKFLPYDWETPGPLNSIVDSDLIDNGLIDKDPNSGKCNIKVSPQEKLIIKYLSEKGNKASVEAIRSCFINLTSQKEAPLQSTFIEILRRKGIVEYDRNEKALRLNVSLIDVYTEAKKYFEDLKKLKDELSSEHDKYGVTRLHYAYLYQEKKRAQWTITLSRCFEVAEEYFTKLSRQYSNYDSITPMDPSFIQYAPYITQPAYIIKMICTTRVRDIVSEAQKHVKAKNILISMEGDLDQIKLQINNMLEMIRKTVDIEIEIKNLEEIEKLQKIYDKALELHKVDPDNVDMLLEKTQELVEGEKLVKGDKLGSIIKLQSLFNNILEEIRPKIDEIWQVIRRVKEFPDALQRINEQIQELEKSCEDSSLAKKILEEIKSILPSKQEEV